MKKGKLLLVFCISFFIYGTQSTKAQTANVAIVLNEYCVSNTTGPADNYGQLSDWVEIYNAHTASVSLAGYYLSNERSNLKKWRFPANVSIGVGGYHLVWLSGRNAAASGTSFSHANFTIEQSKGQWLILSTPQGAIRDSVYVQRTKAGHTRGRFDYNTTGINAWRLYTQNSQLFANPTLNYYTDYLPAPKMFSSLETNAATLAAYPNAGGFFADGSQIIVARYKGALYDTTYNTCEDLFYTTDGSYPVPNAPNTTRYVDTLGVTLAKTTVLRMIAVPRYSNTLCPTGYLPSFCETNTYFLDVDHQTFSEDFGVISLSIGSSDSVFFTNQGNPPSSTLHVEYYDKKKQFSEGYAIVNRPINEEWLTKQRGFYMSIDDRYGAGSNFEGKIFNVDGLGASSRTVFPTLHLKSGDIESHSQPLTILTNTSVGTGIRDIFVQSLAAKYKLNVNPLHIKPVITFVNGKYVGVNDLREVYDKYYEAFYNGQSDDSLDLCFYHNGEGTVSYPDGSISTFKNNFRASVFNKALLPLGDAAPNYKALMTALDKNSFIDYMILNSFAMNSNAWNYNVAFAKGGQAGLPGEKWHYYLWNMPTAFGFTSVATNTVLLPKGNADICAFHKNGTYPISARGFNGHGMILFRLMHPTEGNKGFQLEYKNRYQDLLNTAFKCDNLKSHFEYVYNLYLKEMKCHEDPGCTAGPSPFSTIVDQWDSNMVRFYKVLDERCYYAATSFTQGGCYGSTGPFPLVVDVEPQGAGWVKLNSMVLDTYPWSGNYYGTLMSFKAIPTSTTQYRFHHWKLDHTAADPVSKDSIGVQFAKADHVTAVFTDITKDIANSGDWVNVPSGFSPNGDGINETFKPLGSAEFVTEYQMSIWNRWGQEVFRSTNPAADGWDGSYNGSASLTGVYAYVITYKNSFGEAKILKGNVTLTR